MHLAVIIATIVIAVFVCVLLVIAVITFVKRNRALKEAPDTDGKENCEDETENDSADADDEAAEDSEEADAADNTD